MLLSLRAFAQYGNMKVIEPEDIMLSQIPAKEIIIGEGFAGVFVEVLKDSKVKITVSVKCDKIGKNNPIMKLKCENQCYKHIIWKEDYFDYSSNFSLKKGTHFIKIEFMPIFNEPKKAIIERFFVSGNNCKYIDKVTDKTILDSCKYMQKKDFLYGRITKEKTPLLEKDYDILVNEETDLNSDYVESYVDLDDIFSNNALVNELVKITKSPTLRVIFNGEDLKLLDVFKYLNYANVYNMDVEVYNLQGKNTENLLNIIKICRSLGIKSVILGENTPIFSIKK